jgi:hypothetical protein
MDDSTSQATLTNHFETTIVTFKMKTCLLRPAIILRGFLLLLLLPPTAAEAAYYSPATGFFRCPHQRNLMMLLNYRAVQQGGCRIALDGFRQNVIDSVGSVVFISPATDGATASLACRNDTQTALRIDDSCTCQPINPSGEGCTRTTRDAFVTLPSGPAPFLVKTAPDASKPWTRSYAPATGHYRCPGMSVGSTWRPCGCAISR